MESNDGDENDDDGENGNGGGDELMMMKMKIKVIMGVVDVVHKWGDFMVDWWEDGAIIMSGRVFDHHHGPFFQLDFFSRIGFVHILSDLHKRKPDHHHHFFFLFSILPPNYQGGGGSGNVCFQMSNIRHFCTYKHTQKFTIFVTIPVSFSPQIIGPD